MSPQVVADENVKKTPLLNKFHRLFSFLQTENTPLIGSHRNGIKRASFLKISQSFYNTPSLIQRNSEGVAQSKINSIYKLFTGFPLLNLPFRNGIFASKNSIPIHFIKDFARGIMRTKLQSLSLNSHENGVLAGYFFKNSKYIYKYSSQLIALGAIKT